MGAPAWRGHANNAAKKQQPGYWISGGRDYRDAYRGKRASHIIKGFPGTKVRRRGVPAPWRVRMIMDVVEIQKVLPDRYAFMLVGGIVVVQGVGAIVIFEYVSIHD